MKVSGIYQIKNKINNKIYIGSSVNIKTRWYQHRRDLKLNQHCNKHLQNAWNKYGEENFEFSILEIVKDKNELQNREQSYIDLTNCCNENIGYNINSIAVNSPRVDYHKTPKIKISKKDKERIKSEQIFNSYLKFIDKVSKELGVTRDFVKESIDKYDNLELNINKKEIIKRDDVKLTNLFSGLIKCLDCSRKYKSKKERNNQVYICSGYDKGLSDCKRFVVHEKDLINIISNHFQENVIDLNLIASIEAKSPNIKITYIDGTRSIISLK